jgi:HEAT repeat protein
MTQADIPIDLQPELKKLIEITFSEDVHERARAAQEIGEMHERAAAAVPFLMRLLEDNDSEYNDEPHFYAHDALVSIGDPALDAIIRAGANTIAIRCLSKFESPRADQVLIEIMESSNADTSGWAAECFTRRRDPQCVKPLLKLLHSGRGWFESDVSWMMRQRTAVEALGFQRDERAVGDLRQILDDPKRHQELRARAAWSLGQISTPQIIPALIEILQDRTLPTVMRIGAARGIGAYRPELSIADSGHMDVVRDDARLLTLLGNILKSNDEPWYLRTEVAQAMGEFGNRLALKTLMPVAEFDQNQAVRFWSAVSVVKLTDGPIGSYRVVAAIRDYRTTDPEGVEDLHEQRVALQQVAARGTATSPWAWLVVAFGIGALAVVGASFAILKCRRSVGGLPPSYVATQNYE